GRPAGRGEGRPRGIRRHAGRGDEERPRRAGGRRGARAGPDLGRGGRPADAAPVRRRDGARLGAEDEPAPGRRGRPPDRGLGGRGVGEEGARPGGWAGEGLARATEQALGPLDDAWRIATPNSPIPYSPPLEDAFLPGPERIADEIRRRLR